MRSAPLWGLKCSAGPKLTLTWLREDFLKAQGNKSFVPFSVALDPSKVSGGTVALYWRVVAKGAVAEPATKGKNDDKDKDKDAGDRKPWIH